MPPPIDDWQRPGPTPRQRRIDLVIALVVTAGALLNVFLSRSVGMFVFDTRPHLAEQIAWAVAICVPLVWRRVWPDAVLVVIGAVFIAGQVRGSQEIQFAGGALFAAIYAAGAWGRDRVRARWLRAGVIGSMFVWLAVSMLLTLDQMPAGGPPGATGEMPALMAAIINGVLTNMLMFGFAYFFGETAWLAARRQRELEIQAEQLRATRSLAEERAAIGERVRIARELHDVVAHHVSVMGIQAAAARRVLDRSAAGGIAPAREALGSVEVSARTAVDELRRMLGALRAPDGDPDPPPGAGIERIDELIGRVREAGLTATFGEYGDPLPLPTSMSQVAYRIVQESLTNTLKHAHATTVDVRVRYHASELEIDVTDDGRGGPVAPTGMGIVGMRERVAVHDGTIEAAARPGGGFRVRVRLPLVLAERS